MCSDLHGDMQDPESVRAILNFVAEFKPEIRVIAGDLWDFRQLRKGASDEEKLASLEDDWSAGISFADRFFAGGKENVFLRGNHDERLWNLRESATGLTRDYAAEGIRRVEAACRRWKAKMLPYDSALGIYKIGSLTVIHGYHAGQQAASTHARIYGNAIFGHVHTIEACAVPSLEPAEARSIGCMCRRDMPYINSKTGKLRWGHGFAYGVLNPDRSYTLFQARKINGKFDCATEIKSY